MARLRTHNRRRRRKTESMLCKSKRSRARPRHASLWNYWKTMHIQRWMANRPGKAHR